MYHHRETGILGKLRDRKIRLTRLVKHITVLTLCVYWSTGVTCFESLGGTYHSLGVVLKMLIMVLFMHMED